MRRLISVALILCCLFLCACGSSAEGSGKTDSISVEETIGVSTQAKAEPSIFNSKETGISFILPAGWDTGSIDDLDDSVLITADSDDAPLMLYNGRDLWSEQFGDGQDPLPRSLFNNDLFSEADVAEIIGADSSEIQIVNFGNTAYYQGQVDDFDGNGQTAIMWCRLDYGWVDLFTFCGPEDDVYYSQFVSLISSAVYDREFPDEELETVSEQNEGSYLAGEWSDELFRRNGCSGYPFILDTPIEKCKGFTVDYAVTDVTDGKMKDDAKFQIFYQTIDGTWVKGETFTLDDGVASVEQTTEKPVTVTQVIVICLNSGNFSWKESMGISNPVY